MTTLENSAWDEKDADLVDTYLSVSSVTCIPDRGRHFQCGIAFDDGDFLTFDVLVAPDGESWVSVSSN